MNFLLLIIGLTLLTGIIVFAGLSGKFSPDVKQLASDELTGNILLLNNIVNLISEVPNRYENYKNGISNPSPGSDIQKCEEKIRLLTQINRDYNTNISEYKKIMKPLISTYGENSLPRPLKNINTCISNTIPLITEKLTSEMVESMSDKECADRLTDVINKQRVTVIKSIRDIKEI